MTYIEAIKKFLDSARSGKISQADYDFYNQIIDVDASLASTQKYMNSELLTLDKTTVYRAINNKGELSDGYVFLKPNLDLGRVYGSVKSRLYNKTFFVLDSILQDKIRFIAVVETRLKKPVNNGGGGGGNGGGVTPPDNTKDTTKDTTKETGTKLKPMVIVGGLGVLIGVYLLFSGK